MIECIQYHLTNFLFWVLCAINKSKHNALSQKFFNRAEAYNTKPGTFNYHYAIPDEWEKNIDWKNIGLYVKNPSKNTYSPALRHHNI